MEIPATCQLNIRPAQLNDLTSINIIAQQVHNLHVTLRPDLYTRVAEVITAELFRDLLANALVFVGEIKKVIVSYAVCLPRNVNVSVMTKRQVLLIDALANDEQYRNYGVGRKMMEYIFDYARQTGYQSVELQAIAGNTAAIEFYRHLGWSEKAVILEKKIT